jgi:hypothetical protein
MLHAMHYFMSRIITFTKASAEKVVGRLRRPQELPFAQALTSTLLNSQIRQAMQRLLREMTRFVLEGLEKAISLPKTKANWADTFCVVLVLCICLEAVQVASDSYAMAALRDDPKCGLSRAAICQELDVEPFKRLTDLFHMAYKTRKAAANKKSKKGFNPIRNGVTLNQGEEITPEMVDLVNEINLLIRDHGKSPFVNSLQR